MGTGLGEITEDAKSTSSGEGSPNGTHGESQKEGAEEADDENIAEGLEAEEGDFVNVEVAFAYRARKTGEKDLKKKSKNAHLFLAFYLPGSIRFRKSSNISITYSPIVTVSFEAPALSVGASYGVVVNLWEARLIGVDSHKCFNSKLCFLNYPARLSLW